MNHGGGIGQQLGWPVSPGGVDCGMTTERDHGSDPPPTMLRCPITGSNLYPTLVAALRDMRHANGRDPTTGEGVGSRSWIGLSIAMIVLDTLTREDEGVADRWKRLLTAHEVSEENADLKRIRRKHRLLFSFLDHTGLSL